MGRVVWVDYAKGIGIILVVLGHVLLNSSNGAAAHLAARFIYSFHMPLFFFLAGLFVIKSVEKETTTNFILNKAKRLLYPYFIWSIFEGSIRCFLSSKMTIQNPVSISDLLAIPYQPIYQYWFVYVLFICFCAFSLAYKKDKNLMGCLIITAIAFAYRDLPDVQVIKSIFYMFIFFIIGAAYSKYNVENMLKSMNPWIFPIITVLFVGVEVIYLQGINTSFIKFVIALLGIAFTIGCSMKIAKYNILSALKYLGSISMPIYLSHVLCTVTIRLLLNKVGLYDSTTHIIFETAFGIGLPVLSVVWLEKTFIYRWPFGTHAIQIAK